MGLRFWSWIYRVTGWYSPFAELAEYRYLQKRWSMVAENYGDPDWDMDLETAISLEVGTWQGNNGFYRKWDSSKYNKQVEDLWD